VSGVFFAEQSVEAISSAVGSLTDIEIDPKKIAAHAAQFGRDQFFQKMRAHIDGLLAEKRNALATNSSRVEGRVDHR
jgi:hypothetical protein